MRQGKYPFVLGFLIAPVALYVTFVVAPILQSFYVATTDWSGLSPKHKSVGLDNFTRALENDAVWLAIKHHVVLLAVLPVITIALALFFSFLVNMGGGTRGGTMRGVRGAKFYRVIF